MVVDLLVELGLDGLKQVLIENGRLLPFEDFALESDFADIEAIAKQMRERAARERNAADGLARLESPDLGYNASLARVSHQEVQAACSSVGGTSRPRSAKRFRTCGSAIRPSYGQAQQHVTLQLVSRIIWVRRFFLDVTLI